MKVSKKQTPTPPNEWLYEDWDGNTRQFYKVAYLPQDKEPLPECTNAEKEQWEEDHPQPEPEPELE